MRKKAITKILACACVVGMAASFTSCEKKPTSAVPSGSETSASDVSNPVSEEGISAEEKGTEVPSTTATASPIPGLNKPTDTTTAVQLYNDAVAKKGAVSAMISREMLGGKVAIIEIAALAPTAFDQFKLTNAPLEGADLYTLNPGNVAGIAIEESGDNYVITFTLNSAVLNNSSAHGDGGYMYFIDVPMISETINVIGQSIMNDPTYDFTVKEEKVEISATSGKFVATINKTTGLISSAEIVFAEDIKVPLSKPISGTAKVQCQGTVKYTVA